MHLAAALLLVGAAQGAQQVPATDLALRDAWQEVNEGQFARALERAEQLPAGAARFELEAEALYLGRRFEAARDAARAGLSADPDQPRLALRALQASLWLANAPAARRDHVALERAVTSAVEPEHREAWQALVRQHGAEIEALERRGHTLERARGRVGWLVGVLAPVALVLLGLALRASLGGQAR